MDCQGKTIIYALFESCDPTIDLVLWGTTIHYYNLSLAFPKLGGTTLRITPIIMNNPALHILHSTL